MINKNYKNVKYVLWVILFANLLVSILKIIIGFITKSSSITADGFHSISDASSNIIGLIGINFASKPQDKEHPYGHYKFEIIAGLFIGIILLAMGLNIIIEAKNKFLNPTSIIINKDSILILLITLIINIIVSIYEYKKGKKLNSYILISDSLHTRSDIFVSIGVIIGVLGIKAGLPVIVDPIISLGVSICIFHSAYEIFKSSVDILVDKAVLEESNIIDILKNIDEIKDVHKIRSRGSENNIYIDMHIVIDPNMTVYEAHNLEHKIFDIIKTHINENIQVDIHIEPYLK